MNSRMSAYLYLAEWIKTRIHLQQNYFLRLFTFIALFIRLTIEFCAHDKVMDNFWGNG